jgi:NAD+ diphosphatase
MMLCNLPFSRKFAPDFEFHLGVAENVKTKGKIFLISGYRYKIVRETDLTNFLFFGFFNGMPCYAKNVDAVDNGINLMSSVNNERERTLAGVAISSLKWSEENKFCGRCGSILGFMDNGEIGKICKTCNLKFFTRINPAIIVLVKKGDKFLLTRKKEWRNNRYGLVAGFLEYGETAEESVEREVFEETGILIDNIEYVSSQFWPFPYQLMLGYRAEFKSGDLCVDKNELDEAEWFSKYNLPPLPPKSSIARFLIDISL